MAEKIYFSFSYSLSMMDKKFSVISTTGEGWMPLHQFGVSVTIFARWN